MLLDISSVSNLHGFRFCKAIDLLCLVQDERWGDSHARVQSWFTVLGGASLASGRTWVSDALEQALGSSAAAESSKASSAGGRDSSLSLHASNHAAGASLALSTASLQIGSVGCLVGDLGGISSSASSRSRHEDQSILVGSSSRAGGEGSVTVLLAASKASRALGVQTLESTVVLGAKGIFSIASSTSRAHSSGLDHAISNTLSWGGREHTLECTRLSISISSAGIGNNSSISRAGAGS
jgi:hypothetical protein